MPAAVVPDLKHKFTVLRTFPTPRTWPELAKAFGVPYKTLQSWQDGSTLRKANRVPERALPILTRLVSEALPGTRSPDEIRQFVFGPGAQFEEEVRTGASVSLLELVAREARRDTAFLHRRGATIELVEIEPESHASYPRLKLGESFRIEIRRRFRSGYAVTLQHAQRAWALLPSASSPHDPAMSLVPGVHENGKPQFMHERRDVGRHLFVCIETPAPPPASVMALSRDDIAVDKRALDAIAAFYEAQSREKRACHLLALEFEAGALP